MDRLMGGGRRIRFRVVLATALAILSAVLFMNCSPAPSSNSTAAECGSADGVTVSSAPNSNLCSSGNPSSVTGVGSYNWTCSLGSSTVSCFAPEPAYYVATNGNDNNAGTLAAPFATLVKAQSAMLSSSTKVTYMRAGTYSPVANTSYAACDFTSTDGGTSVVLGPSDSGEIWSYYPPDGYNSAVIDGGSTAGGSTVSATTANGSGCAFGDIEATNVSIVGLQFQHYRFSAFFGYKANNLLFVDNVVHDLTSAAYGAGGVSLSESPSSTVENNYMYNLAYEGFATNATVAGGNDNITVANNVIINSCTWPAGGDSGNDQDGGDCGAIYFYDGFATASTGYQILNNYIRDINTSSLGVGEFGGATGIYLDASSSNATATGNVITGIKGNCFQIHGGTNNVLERNLCDLGSVGPERIIFYLYYSTVATAMMGNTVENNIIIASSSGSGGGYYGYGSTPPPNPITISNNAYYNYGGSTVLTTGVDNAGSDSNPTYVNPQISCPSWSPLIQHSSPVLSSPVNFSAFTGNWGPPGFTIPQTGTAPSWLSQCSGV